MQIRILLLLSCCLCTQSAVQHHHGFLEKAALGNEKSGSLLRQHPYYHSTDGLHDELVALSSKCPGMKLETRKTESRSIDVVTIRAAGSSPVNKIFMLFGEHARELISPESSLHLIKNLCGKAGNTTRASQILKDSEFQIVVNGNPESRKLVEQGDVCLRANPNGVDLNRNWDEEWQVGNMFASMSQTYPGEKPFSEPETRLFKELVSAYKPTNFVSVHSGTKGMYMPWAYDEHHMAKRNQAAMLQVLRDLSPHCECPFGAAGKELESSCPGSSLDWVYDKLKTPYAFAFEIYGPPQEDEALKDTWTDKMQEEGAFYQTNSTHAMSQSDDDCFPSFNPDSQEGYDKTLESWSAAYLDMAELVASNLKKQDS